MNSLDPQVQALLSDPLPPALPIPTLSRPPHTMVEAPGSKSITNRALLLAALANGESTLEGALFSDDTRLMEESLNRLGISVNSNEPEARYRITGAGGRIPAHGANLFVGNAGTAARFLTALCALGSGTYRIDGVARMRERPIRDLLDALRQLGVDAEDELGTGCPPAVIRASGLFGGKCVLRGDASSQYLSALLMVAPLSQEGVQIEIAGELASKPYVDITLRMMAERGVQAENRGFRSFHVPGCQAYLSARYRIEPDASSASYFFAAAAVTGGRITVRGLRRDAMQGDTAFVDVLAAMGCQVGETEDGLWVQGPEQLRGVEADMNAISDTVMTLAAIAPFADSPTTIRNVANIRIKETDRLSALTAELRRLGVEVEERPDGVTICPAAALKRAEIETYDDHRMAMSFAVAGLRSPGIVIKNPGCVGKTFPGFFRVLAHLFDVNPTAMAGISASS